MKIDEAKKILEAALTNDIKLDAKTAKRIQKAKEIFISHYRENVSDFLGDFIKILDGSTNEEISFNINPAQQLVLDAFDEGHRFVAVPKARQTGQTTLSNGIALHHSIFVDNANVICMAIKAENAQENLRRIKTMYKTMPEWVQKLFIKWDDKKHLNNQSLWTFTSKVTGTENKLEVSSAASEDSTRGKTPTMLHFTEVAFAEYASNIFTSVFPALNRRKESIILLESTGNGNSGFYYEACIGLRKGFKVVFLPWHVEPQYRQEGEEISALDREYIKDLMGVEEIPKHLDDDQLRWFKFTSETVGKAKCQQEFPINIEQVFQATNSSFFSFKTMQKLKSGEILRHLNIEDGYLQTRITGPGEVYEEVKTQYEYLISVDSSEGVNDPSVLTILNPKGEEVLFWREKMVPDELVKLLDVVGKQYNNAAIVVENNGIGAYVINSLMGQYLYPNIVYIDNKPGFKSTSSSKPEILALLQDYILHDKISFKNSMLAHEMSTFEADTLKAVKGNDIHDDAVIACAISAYAFKLQPPKMRYVEERYNDYTREVYRTKTPRRRFII